SHIPYKSEKVNSFIKVVTDGTFMEEIRGNPILKRRIFDEYSQENLYDVIMIDESHEHNLNMDLILTLLKYAIYYNNSLKLVIMSATMDEDESILNSYYRDINDNRIYPWSFELSEKKLDRINVGRRLHIAPIGEGTKFKIKEQYVLTNDEKLENLNMNELLDMVMEYAITSARDMTIGDILVFLP